MILSTDLNLYYPLWEKADNELCNKKVYGIFGRLIDLFIVACAIGIKEDKTADAGNTPLESPKTIGRNTYQSGINEDLSALLEFMLQNAILNSKTIDFDDEKRIRLAFDPEYQDKKFSPASFLIGFANYGLSKIYDSIKGTTSLVIIAEIYDLLDSLRDADYTSLVENLNLLENK